MKIITLDFETYWDSKLYTLSKMGPIQYIRDPRFHAQLLSVRIDRGDVAIFDNDKDIADIIQALELHKSDRCIVGHNVNGFDGLILSERFGVKPAHILDTQVLSRWTGVSRLTAESHAALTEFFATGFKRAGTVISDGKNWPHDFTPEQREDFKSYCCEDTFQCSENFFKMLVHCGVDTLKFATLTARMATEPVFYLDGPLLVDYLKQLEAETEKAWQDLSQVFRLPTKEDLISSIRSATVFPKMLRSLGVEPPMKFSAKKTDTARKKMEAAGKVFDEEKDAVYTPALAKTDLEFLDLLEHHDPRVQLLVQTRLDQNSSILKSRAERFLTLASDTQALPIMLQAFRAHTSRYTAGNDGTSDGLNFQNLNKRNPSQLTLRRAIKISSGMKVVAADSSQIEARILAWLACQDDLVEIFRQKGDPYSELAEKIFNVPWQDIKAGAKAGDPKMETYRSVGKTGILSAGYGVGWRKLSNTLLRNGAKLHENLDKHHELAKHAHEVYRLSNQRIVGFWDRCKYVIGHLYQGGEGLFGGPMDNIFNYGLKKVCEEEYVPSIAMPSGYMIRYPGLRMEKNERGKLEFLYDQQKGRNKVGTRIYGGKLTENLCQGLSFQLLMWQACRMADEGLIVKGNNHDCWFTVVPDAEADHTASRMEYWMCQTPPWLEGFPVSCEVKIGVDYTIC